MRIVYLNANLIFSDVIPRVMKKWDDKPQGTLLKLKKDYNLTTSVLTRFEVIQNLTKRFNFSVVKARKLYFECINLYEINEVQSLDKYMSLNSAFFDSLSKTNLELKDALHLTVCRSMGFIMCTHDVKMRRHHALKKKFYDKVFKPGELINDHERS